MKNTVYVFGESSLLKIVMEILPDYKIAPLTFDQLNNQNFENNNAIFFSNRDLKKKIKKHFFLQNNAIFFIRDNKDHIDQKESQNANFNYGRLGVKKFVDEIKTCFIAKKVLLNGIEIFGDNITNITLGISALLTPLEKEILIMCQLKL